MEAVKMKKRIIIALMSSTLILGACQSPNDPDEPEDTTEQPANENSTNEEEQPTNDNKGIQNADFDISSEHAVTIFQEEYGEMDVYAVELTTEEGVYQYESKGYKEGTEQKSHIDADSGEILDDKEKDEDGNHMYLGCNKLS